MKASDRLGHQRLPLVHRGDDPQVGQTAMRDFARDHRARDHADDVTAVRKRGVGHDAHQSDAAAAEHDAHVALRQLDGDRFSGRAVLGSHTRARSTEDADAVKHGSRPLDSGLGDAQTTNLYPSPWTV